MSVIFDDNGYSMSRGTIATDVVTEAYYGKSKELKEAEKELDMIAKKIKNTYNGKQSTYKIQPHIDKVEKLLCKHFKLGGLVLNISFGMPNATTAPVSLPKLIRDKKFNWKRPDPSNMYVTIYMTDTLIYDQDLSGEEMMAFILHEIGHNMDVSLFFMLAMFGVPSVGELIGHVLSPYLHYLMGQLSRGATDLIASVPGLATIIYSIVDGFTTFRLICHRMGFNRLENIRSAPIGYLKEIIKPKHLFGYAGEKYADSFATSYGYGAALANAFKKVNGGMTSAEKTIYQAPVVSCIYDTIATSISIPFILCDEHPADIIRVNSTVKKLRRELNDPTIPKQLKKDISEQLDEVERILDSMTDISSDENKNRIVSTIYNYIVAKVFDGMLDPREAVEVLLGKYRHEE